MSTTIDQRVVEMRFDNKQFERGVSETMSTLEKLKQRLNFKGAVKGVESVNSAAKGVNANMTGLGGAVEQVSLKFSALQVMGVTALSRLTNSAITAGTRIAKALTIDPITTGFSEYETQINAVQTILANTSHAGTTIQDVNKALDDLNKYADMTIYNFTEMTRNIGTFTAAGVDLETSTSAIKGIANLAAVSGSTSQQASTAMYQLSQALAAGRVSLMDWNSVVNAGMGGKVFQDALIRTSEAMGTGAQAAIDKYGSFRESLTKGEWLTTDVLTETLNQFTMAAKEGSEEWNKFKAELKEKGYTDEQATAILKMANTATDAATKVKTFTQLWDVLKESAQSGWTQTWELIIGDYEEAKNLLTPISDALTGLIGKFSDFRNAILESALGRTFGGLSDKFNTILKPAQKVMEVATGTAEAISDLGGIVEDVIGGKFGNGADRLNALTEAGVNYYKVQNKVNEQLGCAKRYSQEQIEAQDKLLGTQTKITEKSEEQVEATEGQAEATVKLTDAQKKQLIEMSKLSDAELRQKGYTWEQIEALRELQKVAENLGIPFDKFINQLDEINGRWLLINGFKNIGNALADVGRAIGTAWKDVFPEHSIEYFADKLFDLLGSFHKLTAAMADVFYVKIGEKGTTGEAIYKLTEAGEKLVRTFKGVFAAVDLVATIVGGGFKIAFKIVSELFGRFGLSILDVTAIIGDAVVEFRDFVDSIFNVSGIVDFLVPLLETAYQCIVDLVNTVKNSKWFGEFCNYLNTAAEGLKNLFSSIPDMSGFQSLVSVLTKAKTAFQDWIQILKDSENIPADIIAGLVKGITAGVPAVLGAVFELAKSIISGICEVLGIHSPARAMIAIGGFIIAGLIQGIAEGKIQLVDTVGGLAEDIWATAKTAFTYLGERIVNLFKSIWDFVANENGTIDWGKIFAGGVMGSLLWVLIQFANAFKGLTDGIGGIGDILEEAGDCLKKFGKVLTAYSWDLKAKALQKLAISVAILVGAIVVLAQINDIGKLWNAVGIIFALSIILVGLAVAMDRLTGLSIDFDNKKIDGLKTGLMQIALAMVALSYAVKIIDSLEDPGKSLGWLLALAIGLGAFLGYMTWLTKYAKDMNQFGSLMLKLGIAMGLMVMVFKMVDTLTDNQIAKGIIFATGFALFVTAISRVAKTAGNNVSKVGGLMIKLSIAMGLMVGIMKLAATLSGEEIVKGTIFAAGFTILVKALVACTKIGKKQQIAKLGGLIMAISTSMMLMIGVCKLAGMLKVSEMIKGAAFAAGFTLLVKVMVGILNIGSEAKLAKVTGTILAMSIAIGILAAVSVALGFVDLGALAKGVAAVSILCGMMALMVRGLKGAQNVSGSIYAMAIAIGVMTAAIVALTFIDDTSKLAASVAAISIVMGMFALMERYSKNIKKAIPGIAVMVVAVGMLAGILYLLTNNIGDADAAIKVATSLGILMAAMAVSLKIVAKAGPNAMSAMPAMGVMLLIVSGIAVILGVLDKLDVAPSIETATSLSILLLAMAGVTAILTLVGAGAPAAVAGVAAFAIVVAGIGALMLALAGLNKLFPKMEEWLDSGIGVLQKIGEGIGKFIGGFIGGIGEGMMDSMLDMTDTLIDIMNKLVVVSTIGKAVEPEGFDGVKKLLDVFVGIALTSAGTSIGDMFSNVFSGKSTMEKFESDCVAFCEAMKSIAQASSGITIDEAGFNAIVDAAGKLAELQSALNPIGGVISWFTGRDDLGTFGENVKAFIDQMKLALGGLVGFRYDTAGFSAITTATGELANLQSSLEPIGGVITWFKGRDDLATFGVNIGEFFASMKTALSNLEGLTLDAVGLHTIIHSATKLSELQSSLEPIDGVIQFFTGRSDLSTFGVNIGQFISSMKTALSDLEGATLDPVALESIITAGKKLAGFQETLEPMGSAIDWFVGRDDLGTFGEHIKTFAQAMGTLKTEMGENGITEDVVVSITNAGNAIIELHKALPEEGWFDGKMNLDEFSAYITNLGTAMGEFGKTAGSIDGTAVSSTINSASRIKALIESLVGLDTSGLAAFTGIGTGGFGADGAAYKIAKTVSKYGEEIAGIDTSAISTSVTAITRIKSLIAGLVGLDSSGIDGFKPQAIGSALKSYVKAISGVDSGAVSQSVTAANKLKTFISSLSGLDSSGVGSFKKALNDLGTIEVSKIVKAFSGAGPKLSAAGSTMMNGLVKGIQSKTSAVQNIIIKVLQSISEQITDKLATFERGGNAIVTKIASGISDKKTAMKSAVQACATTAATSIRSHYSAFYDAGSYLVTGFANGISANMYRATAKARAMADAAEKAAREALGINSPSRVFKEIGAGIPEGFALGIKTMTSLIDKPLENMSSVATKSVSDTVSRLAAAIDSDMDVQPTIRPVLDLSNIRTGAGAIGSMLSTGSSVGVLANVGAISHAMNRRGQNVSNADVVSAIDRLDRHLDNVGNTTYTIGGITYDDGSNIATAVRDLTRYARIEGRV